jgi:peptidoglycan/LPS O-acetylase OafA/YrhL
MFGKSKLIFLLILVLSASLCFIVVGISPKTSFFLLPFRLWEFLLGFIVAKSLYKIHYNKSERLKWISTLSLFTIVGIPLFDITGDQPKFMTGHPGLIALLISIATAITLLFGISERIESNPFS